MTGSSRRKNKHPKRAENVKTVVVVRKGGDREEEGDDDDDVERLRRMLMCVPCDDDVCGAKSSDARRGNGLYC